MFVAKSEKTEIISKEKEKTKILYTLKNTKDEPLYIFHITVAYKYGSCYRRSNILHGTRFVRLMVDTNDTF